MTSKSARRGEVSTPGGEVTGRAGRRRTPAPSGRKERLIGWTAATIVKTLGVTLRMSFVDRAGFLDSPPDHPLIWAFWHDSQFAAAVARRRVDSPRRGAALTSASRDGAVVAATLKHFHVDAVRGSSSRRGAFALLELGEWLERGEDVVITPDGPRGPRCEVQPGIIKLAQVTGAPILPVRVVYHNAWTLRSWDEFRIPRPFSRVEVVFEPIQEVRHGETAEDLERDRTRLEAALLGESGRD